MAKVSVIIPVYGVEKYIERCARNLFEQTLDDIEYLFIDDCTQDASIEILKRVLDEYPNRTQQVRIHRMAKNSGQAEVRKWGMQNATGEYIIHCDSDDWNELEQYEKMYRVAVMENADLVYCDFNRIIDGVPTIIRNNCIHDSKYEMIGSMLGGNSTPNNLWACLVKRNLLKNLIYPEGNQGEDKVIMIQLVYNSNKVSYVSEPLYNYVLNTNSITNSISVESLLKRSDGIKSNCDQIIRFLEEKGICQNYKSQIEEYKMRPKVILWPQRKNIKIRKQWDSLYPELSHRVLFNRFICSKNKIIFLIFEWGLWRLI